MKFRTGFVTNSSSYSSAEIKIDNPVLLAILRKYKEIGTFDHIGRIKKAIGDMFEYYEDEVADEAEECTPGQLDHITSCLFDLIEYFRENMTDNDLCIYNKMKDEIIAREEEINDCFQYVYWEWNDGSYDECVNRGGYSYEYENGNEDYKEWKNDEYSQNGITDVVISEETECVGEYQYQDCKTFISVTIPGSVYGICMGAFYGCKSLETVTIEEGVDFIDDEAFYACDALKSVYLPKSITHIGKNVFPTYTSRTIPDLIITAPKGSYAAEYARKNKIKLVEV